MKKLIGAFFLSAFSFILSWLIFFQLVPEDIYPAVSSSLIGGKESFRIISSDPDTRLQLVWAYEAKVPQSQRKKIENYQRIQDLSFKRLKTDETWDLSDEGYLQSGIKGAEFSFVYPKYSDNVYVFCLKTSGGDAIVRHDYPGGHSFYRIEGENTDALPLSSAAESSHAWMIPQWAFTLLSGLTLSGLLIYIFLKYLRTHPLTKPEKLPEISPNVNVRTYLIAFLLPLLSGVFVCIIKGFFPFGNRTFLYNDMFNQYYKFFLYLKAMPKEGNDLFYSFSEVLGGSMLPLFSYYLADPLLWLIRLFPADKMPLFCTLMILLHLGLAGESCFFYLIQRGRSMQAALLFSCAYALMSYNIVCAENLQFLIDMILLPLVFFGLERMIRQQNPAYYVIFLAAALLCSCYFGYMICQFALIWFFFIAISERRKTLPADFLNFLMYSFLAAGIAMIIILPFAASLRDSAKTFSLENLKPEWICKLPELLSKLFTASFDHAQMEYGAPSLFCGTVTTVFVFLFFLNQKRALRIRFSALGIMIVFLLSFTLNTFYLVWHGLNYPVWWPARFAFTFGFFQVSLAAEAFDEKNRASRKAILLTLSLFAVIVFVVWKSEFSYLSRQMVLLDMGFALISLLLISPAFQKLHWSDRFSSAVLFLLLLLDLGLNMSHIWVTNFEETYPETALTASDYEKGYQQMNDALTRIKSMDDGFYRVEYALHSGENPGLLNSTNGLSHFSSTGGNEIRRFLDRLGFTSRYRLSANYRYGSTKAVDSLLGIRYLVSEPELVKKTYPTLFQNSAYAVQKNPQALSFGISSFPDILTAILSENAVFSNQETIFSSILREPVSLFTPAFITRIFSENLAAETEDQYTVWRKTVPDKPGILTWHIQIDRSDMLYAYFPVLSQRTAYISLNDKLIGKTIDPDNYGVIPLGTFQPGEEISVSLQFDAESISFFDTFFMYEDQAELAKRFDEKITPLTNIKKLSSSHLSGEINAEEPGQWLLLTIPYSDEWQVTLNGRPVTAEKVLDALMAVPLEQGHNFLELKFVPKGFEFGAILSCLSLFIFALSELKRHGVSTQRPW